MSLGGLSGAKKEKGNKKSITKPISTTSHHVLASLLLLKES